MLTIKKTGTIEGIESLLLGYEEEVEVKRELNDADKGARLKVYEKELLNPGLIVFAINKDQKPIGIMSYSIRKNGNGNHYADFSRFFVVPEHKKEGIRKSIEDALKPSFKKDEIRYMIHTVESTNREEISSLKKDGYMQIGRYFDDTERREWNVYMKCIQNGRARKSK